MSNQRKVINKMLEEGCKRVHYVGDIVYPRGISSPDDPELCEQFKNPFAPLLAKAPFYITLGNHDHLSNPAAWLKVGSATEQAKFPLIEAEGKKLPSYMKTKNLVPKNAPIPSVVFPGFFWEEIHDEQSPLNGVCVVSIDSNSFVPEKMHLQRMVVGRKKGESFHYHSYKAMRKDQIQWLKNFNQRTQHCKLKIALAHHPFRSTGAHGHAGTSFLKSRYKNFLKKHVIGEFDFLITGHDHNLSFEGNFSGKRTTQVIVSGAGAQTASLSKKREKKINKRIQKGESVFARKTLGFVSISFPFDNPAQTDVRLHYSDEGEQEWKTWSPNSLLLSPHSSHTPKKRN